MARTLSAPVIELHTGTYCHAFDDGRTDEVRQELARLQQGAELAASLGLEVHAGHGLNFGSVGPIAAFPEIAELNIGHFLVGEAIFSGLPAAIGSMRTAIDAARP
jgi:pyridoxine 5-phosphate synthase